jgi:hypothetical protein
MAEWKKIQGTPVNGGVNNTAYAWQYTIPGQTSGEDPQKTASFTFPIRGDFSYIVKSAAGNYSNEATSIKVYGSMDNSTWVELDAATTKTLQTSPYVVTNSYDLDAKGKMPFMCIEVDPDGNTDGAKGAIVYIVDHLE